ncbi:MAG TPA: DUF2341 domain-containing protein [Aquabacterium sp.]|uniref:DUF2341 domain-containing protein n=1 Tax=Aquabacterium sp. TaxID=1872578 RepID=UPI002E31CE4C|nr:DUF2341 domain-containing protein [Aquabacterium sp.]HEX5373987.1 DUF2341 domain-containing protein [Aquabacterium sp.]
MRKLMQALASATLLFALAPQTAQAWWNADWTQRTRVTLNTTAQGVETREALPGMVVPVRLHSGNFDFLAAKPDGSDLRVISGDDKTPLKFWVERFDGSNELALIWVQLPSVLPGTDKNELMVYAGNEAAAAEASNAALFDASTALAIHFSEKEGQAQDSTGRFKSDAAVARDANGLMASAARLDGQPLVWRGVAPASASLAGPWSASLWVKPASATGTLLQQGPVRLSLQEGQLQATVGAVQAAGGAVPVGAWAHLTATLGAGKLTLYINGAQAAQVDVPASAEVLGPDVVVGEGLQGLVDEVQIHGSLRSADWAKLTHAAQSADAKLVLAKGETAESAAEGEGGEPGYMGILVSNLTVDAWVVIGILAVMFLIAAWVMYSKTVLVGRMDKANRSFLQHFRQSKSVMTVQGSFDQSPLARLYGAGLRELQRRDVGQEGAPPLSGASLDAVKAAIDADLVRENQQLNSGIVLLTIAISGGPFLGLLGTVVGVMITFAAIAAAGDVNVNAIAPGIAAALLATVAGLAVAIPALFGYNYLTSRIKNISADMQIFVDEFVTRVAEVHGAR